MRPNSRSKPRRSSKSVAHPQRSPLVLDAATSARLARIRQKDTAPELRVRALLRLVGRRYRLSNRDLPGSPDIANRSERWALFVHGCFWHAHRGCRRASVPKRNSEFWQAKFDANRARDMRVTRALKKLGFRVEIVWACELDDKPEEVLRRLRALPVGHDSAKRES